jgi:Na+/proline symporter
LLQFIYARFGKHAHITYCLFALVTNAVITSCLVLAGRAAIQTLTENASDEFVVIVLATLFGTYSFVGGLGTTFYVSYLNAALTYLTMTVFLLNLVYLQGDEEDSAMDSIHKLYTRVSCVEGPEGNAGGSLLTFQSESGVIFGIIAIFLASSVTFCDQASWQSRIAAKPTQGVLGFLIAAFLWFAVPSTISLTSALAYLSDSFQNETHLLTPSDIDDGK